MNKIILFFSLIVSFIVSGQTYNIQSEDGNVIETCSGTFVDSGGISGNYSSGENYQISFCPSDGNSYVQLEFSSFNVEGNIYDFITVYEGIGAGGSVIGFYGDLSPISSKTLITSSDVSGCITIVFESDLDSESSGWEANISCTKISGKEAMQTNSTSNFIMCGGDGTGTSDLGCPSVIAGGLGLGDVDPPEICPSSGTACVDIEANYLQLGDTSNYAVSSIPYNPPYQFECLANPVSVGVDDTWSDEINLPFDFCFYGSSYSSCVVGSNGILSFDTSLAGDPSGYEFENNLPSTIGDLFANSIYGVYHDLDPSEGGEVGWELITLNSGCRALVASWHDVPMYFTNSKLYTGMMVLYENTNIIEVYIEEKNLDGIGWNDLNAIVGIQNQDASAALVAPGRNALDANWTATNEAWRFTPNGPSITSLTWYEGSGTSGTVVGNTDTINVCPATTTTYTAEVVYTLCDGSQISETEETVVTVNPSCSSCILTLDTANNDQTYCENTAIADIVYTVGGSATGITLSGTLPDGVIGTYDAVAGTYTISGIPTSSAGSPYNYTIETVGCSPNLSETGTFTATDLPTYTSTVANCDPGSISISSILPVGSTLDWISGPSGYTFPTGFETPQTTNTDLTNLPAGTYCVDIASPGGSGAPIVTTLLTEDFESGATNWTIDNSGGDNIFIINNVYAGGTCTLGGAPFTVPNIPNQGAWSTGGVQSDYLHIMATTTCGFPCAEGPAFPPQNANYCSTGSNQSFTLNTPLNTTGQTNVSFDFYYINNPTDADDYGALEYSTDGGIIWTQSGANLFGQGTWFNETITDAAWDNQASLLFRITWTNDFGSSTDPPLALDEITITAEQPGVASCSTKVQECFTIDALPTVAVNGPLVVDCTNTTVTLDGAGSETSGVTYLWSTADGTIDGSTTGITATTSTAGTYTLTVTNTA
ncbi:hypothetical protein OAX11_04925, partial [Flavobacteriaceae bacterium]|nr:hypothetical protein [Flavobacteriaceae bacterium]